VFFITLCSGGHRPATAFERLAAQPEIEFAQFAERGPIFSSPFNIDGDSSVLSTGDNGIIPLGDNQFGIWINRHTWADQVHIEIDIFQFSVKGLACGSGKHADERGHIVSWRLAEIPHLYDGFHCFALKIDFRFLDQNVSPQLSLTRFFLGDERFLKSGIGIVQDDSLHEDSYGRQNYEAQRPFLYKAASLIVSCLLLSIGVLLISIGVDKSREPGNGGLLVFAAWPMMFAAVWLFLTGVLGWHLSTSLNRRAENIVVETVVIAKLKFRDVQRHILAADLVERADDTALEDAPEAFNRLSVNCADDY
jgi:hypothetical protein